MDINLLQYILVGDGYIYLFIQYHKQGEKCSNPLHSNHNSLYSNRAVEDGIGVVAITQI